MLEIQNFAVLKTRNHHTFNPVIGTFSAVTELVIIAPNAANSIQLIINHTIPMRRPRIVFGAKSPYLEGRSK